MENTTISEHQKPDAESKKEQYRLWGKLGGRPKKERKKSVQISVSMTATQKEKLDHLAKSNGLKPQEYLRRIIEKGKISNAERNEALIEFRRNFVRLSNFFESKMWSQEEREEFKKQLSKIITDLTNELK